MTCRTDGQPKYFIRCEKVKPRVLELTPKQDYEALGYYTWLYEGSQTMRSVQFCVGVHMFWVG